MNDMQTLPIDSVPCWCPSWDEIKGKAHEYRTARIRNTGDHVSIRHYLYGPNMPRPIWCVLNGPLLAHYSTEELCDFCL